MNLLTDIQPAKQYDFIVVGAGPAGASFAAIAAHGGKTCLVVDRREHVAGNIYTEQIDGIHVHMYGAHIFHTNNTPVWRFVNKFTEFSNYRHQVVAKAPDNKLYQLPFNMMTFTQIFPGLTTVEELQNAIQVEIDAEHIETPQNLEEQALSMVGRSVYEKLIKGYTEKQWGRPCSELPASIIKRLPLRWNYDSTYFNNAKYQGIPIHGYTDMIINMLTHENIDVMLGTTMKDIDAMLKSKTLVQPRQNIIYTGALDELMNYEFGTLEYRSLSFIHDTRKQSNFQGTSVVNYTDAIFSNTRIIEHKHFDTNCQNDTSTVITHETAHEYVAGVNDPYYPIGDKQNLEMHARYVTHVKSAYPNMLLIGRLAEYKYYDMDAVIDTAVRLGIAAVLNKI